MPRIKRDNHFTQIMREAWTDEHFGIWDNIQQVVTVLITTICFLIPRQLRISLGLLKDPNQNVGRLKTIIPGQIYQQTYMNGITNSTVLVSRDKRSILIHSPPEISTQFINDVLDIISNDAGTDIKVKYIVVPNECHDNNGEDAKKVWADAKIVCPSAARTMVEEAVKVDMTLEECLDELKKEFGIISMISFDHISRCQAERSFYIEIFENQKEKHEKRAKDDEPKPECEYCLFVGQCGVGNYASFTPSLYLSGFQSLLVPRGRFFRHYQHNFTRDKRLVNPYWCRLISGGGTSTDDKDNAALTNHSRSSLHWKAAIFLHGDPIMTNDSATGDSNMDKNAVRDQLLKFYAY